MTAATIGNGLTIEYDVQGDGPPLLLVMGWGAQLVAWPQEFVDLLVAAGFTVIRHDNRDIGLSSAIDAPGPDDPPADPVGDRAPLRQVHLHGRRHGRRRRPAARTTSTSARPTSSARRWAG